MSSNNSEGSGWCGCIIFIIIGLAFCVNKCLGPDTDSTKETEKPSTVYQEDSKVNSHPIENTEDELSEEDKQYLNNSLKTGAAPYTEFYGKGYVCPNTQCSAIKITAPRESDIIVIIKENNENGYVIQHGYICAGDSYQFDIPNGTCQTFFYYGKGWNPNKEMGRGIRGGFVQDEIFSKDAPQYIHNQILTYILQLQRDGNFQTRGSNKKEMF